MDLPTPTIADRHKVVKVLTDGSDYRLSHNPFYDPYDYGAVGNNIADDTAALVACQTAANANEGIRPSPSGRGITVLPPGNFKTTGIATQNSREHWMGLGGTLTAAAANQTVFTVAHGACVLEDFILSQPFRPTAQGSTLHHAGGADCTFRKLLVVGGYWGIEGSAPGDSIWFDIEVAACYSDFVYLHGYNGFWGIRCKLDGDWPSNSAGSHPTSAQIKGTWAPSTIYALGDVVTANGYYHQCSQGGTSAASGSGPVVVQKTPAAEFTDGTVKWKTHRTVQASGVRINSDSFINIFWMTDFTGGHINSVFLEHTTGTNRPQTVKFLDGCEFGIPLVFGLRADSADDVEIGSIIIDNVILANSGTGVITNNVRGIDIHNTMFRQMWRGFSIGPNTIGASVDHNTFGGITGWCGEFQAGATGFTAIGNKCGGSPWGSNANGIRVLPGASDEYIVALNRGTGITGTRWSDGGTGVNKAWAMNV